MSRVLTVWDPEDKKFREREGKAIAARNLWISIPGPFLAFTVRMVWSVVAVFLPTIGFRFDDNRFFWLFSPPGLAGVNSLSLLSGQPPPGGRPRSLV